MATASPISGTAQPRTFDQYWTKPEAAQRLRCSVSSINKWIAEPDPRRRLGMRKAGDRVLIPESAIQDFLHRCTEDFDSRLT